MLISTQDSLTTLMVSTAPAQPLLCLLLFSSVIICITLYLILTGSRTNTATGNCVAQLMLILAVLKFSSIMDNFRFFFFFLDVSFFSRELWYYRWIIRAEKLLLIFQVHCNSLVFTGSRTRMVFKQNVKKEPLQQILFGYYLGLFGTDII